ncbi:MAG: hypothetical protein IJZ45_05240 [Bacteroidaceae bacterium]|nr:hypothetical protein [Bacteroidaceae bacterium]
MPLNFKLSYSFTNFLTRSLSNSYLSISRKNFSTARISNTLCPSPSARTPSTYASSRASIEASRYRPTSIPASLFTCSSLYAFVV